MRHNLLCKLAVDGLVKLTEQAPVLLSYRGVNDDGQPLYELKTKGVASGLLTEKELLDTLAKKEERDA